jgi:hypothetical protein
MPVMESIVEQEFTAIAPNWFLRSPRPTKGVLESLIDHLKETVNKQFKRNKGTNGPTDEVKLAGILFRHRGNVQKMIAAKQGFPVTRLLDLSAALGCETTDLIPKKVWWLATISSALCDSTISENKLHVFGEYCVRCVAIDYFDFQFSAEVISQILSAHPKLKRTQLIQALVDVMNSIANKIQPRDKDGDLLKMQIELPTPE